MPHEEQVVVAPPAPQLCDKLLKRQSLSESTIVASSVATHGKEQGNGVGVGGLAEKCAEVYGIVNDFLHRGPKAGEHAQRLEQAQRQTRSSLGVIREALEQYSLEELSFSYNGGKDCLVLLILYQAGLHAFAHNLDFSRPTSAADLHPSTPPRITLPPLLPAIYILSTNPFPSVTSFVKTSAAAYHLALTSYPTPMVSAFAAHLAAHPIIKAIFVGTRRTDPHGATLAPFAPTDGHWPRFMRVHPVLDWAYVDIWTFLRGLEGVTYCELYDQGYTSLGGRGDTWPNPKLRIGGEGEEERFRPAYELVEDDEERLGRERRS